MSENNHNREKLIECAKKEFLEKGFAKASLRKICADAGLTTGAVYFLFKDKDGLLGAVVQKPLEQLSSLLREHFAKERSDNVSEYRHVRGDHDDLAEQIVGLLYDNYDEMMILLSRSQGSSYENFTDGIIDMLDKQYTDLAQIYAEQLPGKRVNRYMLHWLCHIQVDAFVHLLTHVTDRQQAAGCIKPVLDLLIKGWIEYGIQDDC